MYKVEGTKITMVRGDSFVAAINLTRGEETYTPVEGDTIRFAVKKNIGDAYPCILKLVPIDTLELKLVPADTAKLAFGNYIYDLELEFSDGAVDTFVHNGTLVLLPEVYSG